MAGGTSSSAPIVAGILSLLNGERLAEKLPPLGFVNPFLYMIGEDYPAALNDIVAGNNSGGNRLLEDYVTCEHGFVAGVGWDAATGLGSLNFAAILPHVVPDPRDQNAPWSNNGDDSGSNDDKKLWMYVGLSAVVSAVTSALVVIITSKWFSRSHHRSSSRRWEELLEEEENNIEKHLVQNSSNGDDADGGGPSNNSSLYGGF